MFKAAALRLFAREGREIRRTAALPVGLLRGRRPNIRSPQSNFNRLEDDIRSSIVQDGQRASSTTA
jgi:hypothetical protein